MEGLSERTALLLLTQIFVAASGISENRDPLFGPMLWRMLARERKAWQTGAVSWFFPTTPNEPRP